MCFLANHLNEENVVGTQRLSKKPERMSLSALLKYKTKFPTIPYKKRQEKNRKGILSNFLFKG